MAGVELDGNLIDGATLTNLDLLNTEIVPGGSPYYSYTKTFYTIQDAVGNEMFSHCYRLETFVMPKYAEVIGDNAFDHAEALKELTFSQYVKSIGELAFYNCVSLESLEIPDGCSTLGDMTFYTCYKLKRVHLPATLTSIPFAAFYYNFSLTDLEIPATVKTIENLAFQQCQSLTSLNIPAATYMISPYAFGYCISLTAFNVDAENMDYADIDGVLFNKNKTKLLAYPIAKGVEVYEIPAGTLSAEVSAMANAGFSELIIPEGLISLGRGAVSYCGNLKNVHIPVSLNTEMDNVFAGCTAMENYNVAEGNTLYADIEGVLCDSSKDTLLSYPAGRTAAEYVIPAGIREIAVEAFREVESIESIVGSEGLETIKENAFAYCTSLKSAYLPSTLAFIGEGAFGFTVLSEITCEAQVPPTCSYFVDEEGTAHPFVGVDMENCILNVPEDSVELYNTAPVWSMFNIMPIVGVEGVQAVGNAATEYYDLSGRKVSKDAKGVVICRTADGRTVKVIK